MRRTKDSELPRTSTRKIKRKEVRAYLERVDVLAQSEQVGTSTAFASLDVTL